MNNKCETCEWWDEGCNNPNYDPEVENLTPAQADSVFDCWAEKE